MAIQLSGVQLGNLTGGPSSLNLSDLHDVSIVTPATGEYLRYNSAISEWQNVYITSDVYGYLSTNLTSSNGVTLTKLSGPQTIDISLSLTASGDATGTVLSGNLPLTLATVNTTTGTFGSSALIPIITVNGKGLVTAVSTAAFTGTAPLSTSLAGGLAGNIPYQTAANTTTFLGTGTSSQVLVSGLSPSWTNTPTLTGTNFTGIPNSALTNNSITIGTTNIALGASSTTLSGLTSVSSTSFTGALTGNSSTATTLQTARTISATTDATWSVTFDGSTNVSAALTLATVNTNIGQFAVSTVNGKGLVTAAADLVVTGDVSGTSSGAGLALTLATVNTSPVTDLFQKITTNGKGLVTSSAAVTSADITTSLGYTPVDKAGDTMTGYLILNADPTVNLGAVTKQYVDNIASGVNIHQACETGTTPAGNLTTSTYSNGTSGVGATLTSTANEVLNNINAGTGVGGYNTLSVGSRILVKDQATATQNGIYIVTNLGSIAGPTTPWILTRASDFDGSPTNEIQAGDLTFIQEGTLMGTQWAETDVGTGHNVSPAYDYIIVGTDAITFTQFSGAGTYTAGTGINIASNAISNTGVLSNIAGTGISVSGATGNVTIGNTGVTSALAGANISVSSSTGAVTISVTGTVPTATTATNLAGGVAGDLPYQSAAGTTSFLAAGTTGYVLASGGAGSPSWTNAPALVGTNFTGVPSSSLTNNTITIGTTSISLGSSSTTLGGLTSVTSTSFVGALTGNADTATNSSTTSQTNFSNLTIGGAQVLDATNYNTYVPTLTGTGASGTWGINISGNAATSTNSSTTSQTNFSNLTIGGAQVLDTSNYSIWAVPYTKIIADGTDFNTISGSGFYRLGALGANAPSAGGYGQMFQCQGADTFTQVYGEYNTGNLYTRSGNGAPAGAGTNTAWASLLSSANYNSYVPTLTGGGASGTWGINVTGNANTATTASQANTLLINGGYRTFNWSGQPGQPTWLFGSSDGANIYVWNPSNFSVAYSASAGNAASVNMAAGRTDPSAYPVVWGTTGTTSQMYSCSAVTITSSTGTLNATHGVFTPNTTGVSSGVTVANGDLTTYRSGGTSGVLYLSSSGSNYLYWDSTNYNLSGGGLIVTGDVTAFSDRRIKKDIKPIPDALAKVEQLEGVTFTRIDTNERGTGLIAQDVEKILPEAVKSSTDANGENETLSVAYGNMVGLLVEAIKELNAKVDMLQTEITELKASKG